jgi:hypothetical protein
VRAAVGTYQQTQRLTARISQACLRRLLAAKAQQKQDPARGANQASKDGRS